MDEVLTDATRAEAPQGITPQGAPKEQIAVGAFVGGGDRGVEGGGRQGGRFTERVPGATRAQLLTGDEWGIFVGGIIAQLVEDAKTRLGEAKECIDWYQKVYDREAARLRTLEEMGERANQVFDPED